VALLQVSAYVVLVDMVVDKAPDVGRLPLHPPDAVQLFAPLADQRSVIESPAWTLPGESWKLIVGAAVEALEEPVVEEAAELPAEPTPELARPSASSKQPAMVAAKTHPSTHPASRTTFASAPISRSSPPLFEPAPAVSFEQTGVLGQRWSFNFIRHSPFRLASSARIFMPNASAANLSQIANGADWRHSGTIWEN
jgi:hypothetical protein